MDYIYKIMEYKYFFEMIKKKELYFVHPSEWWGKNDGNELFAYCERIRNTENVDLKTILYAAYSNCYAQSWTIVKSFKICDELYYDNNAIMIEVEYKKISELKNIIAKKVVYIDNIIDYISSSKSTNERIIESLCVKQKKFEKENEIRLIFQKEKTHREYLWDTLTGIVEGKLWKKRELTSPEKTPYCHRSLHIAEGIKRGNKTSNSIAVDYSYIKNFISHVYYNPNVDTDILKHVSTFCKNHSLNLSKLEN